MKIRSSTTHHFARSIIAASLVAAMAPALADATYQTLPFGQNWSSIGLISANDDWNGVPGIIGYLGDDAATTSAIANPQLTLAPGTMSIDVIANSTNTTITNGGVAEFELSNPTIALQGSGTADTPFILLHLNTSGFQNIQVSYNLRDLDSSADNAVQPVALQYRIGSVGNFINVPAAYVADATTGPSQATQVTPVSVILPADANNQSQLQLRIITANASGSDEWVGIDDIAISGNATGGEVNQPISTTCPAGTLAQGYPFY